jgi:hypothetical protein
MGVVSKSHPSLVLCRQPPPEAWPGVNRLAWIDPDRHLARPEVALPERGRRRQRLLVQVAGSHHAVQQVVCRTRSSGRRLGSYRAKSVRGGRMAVQAHGGSRHGIVASLHSIACNAVQCSAMQCNAVQCSAMRVGGVGAIMQRRRPAIGPCPDSNGGDCLARSPLWPSARAPGALGSPVPIALVDRHR